MKTLIILLVLTFSFSSVGLAFDPYVQEYKPQSNYSPGSSEPLRYNPGYIQPDFGSVGDSPGHHGHQNHSEHIYVTPDYDTHRNDLRDQESWASPTPNPFANDPRNYMQQRATPRGYIIQH